MYKLAEDSVSVNFSISEGRGVYLIRGVPCKCIVHKICFTQNVLVHVILFFLAVASALPNAYFGAGNGSVVAYDFGCDWK